MNTTLYLIRHGEVEYPVNEKGGRLVYGPEASLSEEGRQGVITLSKRLKKERITFDAIYASSLPRAQQTAQIIGDILAPKLEIKTKPGLTDIIGPGSKIRTMDELIGIGGDIYKNDPSIERETPSQLADRMAKTIEEILEADQGKTIAVVGHGDPIRTYIDRLVYPERDEPSIARDELYLAKGEAWRLVFDKNFRLLVRKLVQGETESGQPLKRRIY